MIAVSKKDLRTLFNQLKNSAKKRGIQFDLTVSDLCDMSFPITCPVFGFPLAFNNGKQQDNSYSVDRIDNTKGYQKDNIVIVSYKANKLKSTATINEMQQLIEFYQSYK